MKHLLLPLLSALLLSPLSVRALTPTAFFTSADQQRLVDVFVGSLAKAEQEELANLHGAAKGLQLIGETAQGDTTKVCKRMQEVLASKTSSTEDLFLAAEAGKALGCKLSPSADTTKALEQVQTASDSQMADLYYAVMSQKALGKKIDAASVLKTVQTLLKKDDGLPNLGYAFRLAAAVDGGDAKAVFSRLEDALVQADEVDGKLLQFEGGLSVTNLILGGVYRLAEKMDKPPPLSKMQAVKFANYFLSRKSVQTPKGGLQLLEALTSLTTNKFHIPVAITLGDDSSVVSEASPKVTVKVTNLFGQALGKMDVTVDSAMRVSDGAVIMSKSKMAAMASDSSAYDVDMMAAKPGKGFYQMSVTAMPSKADARLAGNEGAELLVKALGSVEVVNAEIGVGDADQATAPKLTAVSQPKKLSKVLEANHHQKILFKFVLKDKASSEKFKVHQAFVRMVHVESDAEIIFVAEPDSALTYKFELDLSSKGKDFGGRSGLYNFYLIVGDAVVSNPFSWHVADITLNVQTLDPSDMEQTSTKPGPKPEIRHLFREPESRPPASVSNLFTILCLLPVVVMFLGWLRIGVGLSGSFLSVSALGFHLGLGSIFALYAYFWLQLNMFTTIKYLLMIGVVTFLCGNSMLVGMASQRKK